MNRSYPLLLVFLLIVVGGGGLIGYLNTPGPWFDTINKPSFQPPDWLFGPVWTALYVLIAIAGWRIWTLPGEHSLRMLWSAQLILNFLWSPAFFSLQSPLLALIIIVPMWICILLFVLRAWNRDQTAAMLFLPYLAWVSFATVLNASIVALN